MEFTKQETIEIYDFAVSELENTYMGNLNDIDVAKVSADNFEEDNERVLRLQNIIIKTEDTI
jgi:hypothetical protein